MTERPSIDRYRRSRPVETASRERYRPVLPKTAPLTMLEPVAKADPAPQSRTKKQSKKWLLPVLLTVVSLLIISGAGVWYFEHKSSSIVPKTVSRAVSFPIYYPDPKKLPKGYRLDISSFGLVVKNGVTYSVTYDTNKKIIFLTQPRPTDDELQAFNKNYLPLRTAYITPAGEAQIGAYNGKSFVSLPTYGPSWLVITAPPDIDQDQFKQVLSAMKV
jgi:hypothetical protein